MEKGFVLLPPYLPNVLIYSALICFYLPYTALYLPNLLNNNALITF